MSLQMSFFLCKIHGIIH